MKSLLVHTDNTALLEIKRFEKNEEYFSSPESKGVDEYISEFISERIVPAEADAIFIKCALTDNYLGFLGLRLAYHLRLEWGKEVAQKPIVFVGEETPFELMKLSVYSDILATSGVYHINERLSEAEELLDKIESNELKGLTDYKQFLEQVDVQPPSNYDTRHSIANELSLYLWSKYIGCEDQLNEVQQHIQSKLYFKYKAVTKNYHEVQDKIDALPKFDQNATVMLVDDEAQKGWNIFYENFFSNSEDIQFLSKNIDSRNDQESIIESCIDDLKEIDPDLLLLDLRLNEYDTEESMPEKLTGYKILDEVKKINHGIQVIITTASNKAPIFRELIQAGANGYIIKNNKPSRSTTSLTSDVEKTLKEAKVLKSFYERMKEPVNAVRDGNLQKNVLHQTDDSEHFNNLCHDIQYYIDMAAETFINTRVEERFSYGILQLYKILESLSDYYINKDHRKKEYKFVGEGVVLQFDFTNRYEPERANSHLSEIQLIYNIYYKQAGKIDQRLFQDLYDLFMYRNNYAHHTDPENYDQLEDIYFSNFKNFKKDFYKYYSSVFRFIKDITY